MKSILPTALWIRETVGHASRTIVKIFEVDELARGEVVV